jgi:hypothetical protein
MSGNLINVRHLLDYRNFKLIKGDIEKTIPAFVQNNSGLRIALLHCDCDMYAPTKVALEHLCR